MTTRITFTLKNDKALLKKMDPRTYGPIIRRGMLRSGAVVQRESAIRAKRDTGLLSRSIGVEAQDRSPFPLWVKIGTRLFYAPFQEFGTGLFGPKRRRIRPTKKRALSFLVGNVRVTVSSIKGMKASPFLIPGLEASRGGIAREWKAVSRNLKQMWRRRGG